MNMEQEVPIIGDYTLAARLDAYENIRESDATLQLVRKPQLEHPGFDYQILKLTNFESERPSIWEMRFVQASLGGLVPIQVVENTILQSAR